MLASNLLSASSVHPQARWRPSAEQPQIATRSMCVRASLPWCSLTILFETSAHPCLDRNSLGWIRISVTAYTLKRQQSFS